MEVKLYDPTRPFKAPISIVQTPPEQRVCLLGTRANAVKLMLHWVNGLSVPCIEGNCVYCHLEVRPYAYAPCLVETSVVEGKARFTQAILPVPFTAFDLIDEYNTSIYYTIGRKGNVKTGRMTWKLFSRRNTPLPQPFHVLTHLKQLWEKRIAKLAPVDSWKQFIEDEAARDAA